METNRSTSLESTLVEILELNSQFKSLSEEIGLKRGFESNFSVFLPRRFRTALLFSLTQYRPIYLIKQGLENLTFIKFNHQFKLNKKTSFEINKEYSFDELSATLVNFGFSRVYLANEIGEFSIKGSLIQIITENQTIQMDFFGDSLEQIVVDEKKKDKITISQFIETPTERMNFENSIEFFENIPRNSLIVIEDPNLIDNEFLDDFIDLIQKLKENDFAAVSLVSVGNYSKKIEIENENAFTNFNNEWKNKFEKTNKTKIVDKAKLKADDLEIGDYVVHDYHGIGQYIGREFRQRAFSNTKQSSLKVAKEIPVDEFLVIKYASSSQKRDDSDYLFVPVDNVESIVKYVGVANPKLNRFGGSHFSQIKKKVKSETIETAKRLANHYARRLNSVGIRFVEDEKLQKQLESDFPYVLTPDQKDALKAIKFDMESPSPMDRLLCGDVGFGKTEIALRAAFKCVRSGFQVAILAPTTILSSQHFDIFLDRTRKFAVNVKLLNRFTKIKEKREILEGLKNGDVDILIGTHSILSKSAQFKKLGLLIIDEEQRFGTMHKESIKERHREVDVLTLSATPIPRTLEMAMSGIRDVSVLQTPPKNRKPIKTAIGINDPKLIKEAIETESKRGGQTFFLHNNINTINSTKKELEKIMPEIKFAVAHSKLSERELDSVINSFYKKEIDCLITTTIIETGLDITNANTLIVENSEKFGLTQLHQLRGRIGRSETQAFAYFFYNDSSSINDLAVARLETINEYSSLGDGAKIALRDLEMRGSGNYLGKEQSGHIAGVGYDMYIKMLSIAIEKINSNQTI